MVHGIAAAGVELCLPAPGHRQRRLLGPEDARKARPAGAGARVRADRSAENTPTGFVNAFFAVVTGFALIWHIWWMAALGAFGAFLTFLVFAFREKEEVEIPAETIARFDRAHLAEAAL
jgi:hypothetical protein